MADEIQIGRPGEEEGRRRGGGGGRAAAEGTPAWRKHGEVTMVGDRADGEDSALIP